MVFTCITVVTELKSAGWEWKVTLRCYIKPQFCFASLGCVNILSQSSTSKNNEINGAIGENEAKRQILEQQVERIIDVDIDLDRVHV